MPAEDNVTANPTSGREEELMTDSNVVDLTSNRTTYGRKNEIAARCSSSSETTGHNAEDTRETSARSRVSFYQSVAFVFPRSSIVSAARRGTTRR